MRGAWCVVSGECMQRVERWAARQVDEQVRCAASEIWSVSLLPDAIALWFPPLQEPIWLYPMLCRGLCTPSLRCHRSGHRETILTANGKYLIVVALCKVTPVSSKEGLARQIIT